MIRIGYAPGAYDLFHIGHLNLLRRAKERCDFLIAGVAADQVLIEHKKVTPIIPLPERLEIVRNIGFVDMAHAARQTTRRKFGKNYVSMCCSKVMTGGEPKKVKRLSATWPRWASR